MSDYHELLSAYLDDELEARERVAVDAALGQSADLRRDLAELRVARDLLRGLGTVETRRPVD